MDAPPDAINKAVARIASVTDRTNPAVDPKPAIAADPVFEEFACDACCVEPFVTFRAEFFVIRGVCRAELFFA
jgi:hypothetical protein